MGRGEKRKNQTSHRKQPSSLELKGSRAIAKFCKMSEMIKKIPFN